MPSASPINSPSLREGHPFTVFNYDRRGRGDSGDTNSYAVDREIEDIQALMDAAGGSAYVWGLSSGAILALKAAACGLAIKKLALHEPHFSSMRMIVNQCERAVHILKFRLLTSYPVVIVPSALTRMETVGNGPLPGPEVWAKPLAGSKMAPCAGQTICCCPVS